MSVVTTSSDAQQPVAHLTWVLAEIASALDGTDDVQRRTERVLALTRQIVPYARCSVLKALPHSPRETVASPMPESPEELSEHRQSLERVYDLMRGGRAIGRSPHARPHLAVPLMGLDEVIGVLRVEPTSDVSYDLQHLRTLALVGGFLGAFFVTIHLRERDAKSVAELEAADRFQQMLIGIVSHDLRGPLTAIALAAHRIENAQLEDGERSALNRIRRSAENADRIIKDLLDVTRARIGGGLPLKRQAVDLVRVVEESLDELRSTHVERRIDLLAEEPLTGAWDPGRLSQIVLNLAGNALKHGDPHAPVTVRVERRGEDAVMTVGNEGKPIPPELLPLIFDPFRQGSGKQRHDGLGLGLYIVAQIVAAHGGRIEARSTTERTSFTVTLPMSAQIGGHRANTSE